MGNSEAIIEALEHRWMRAWVGGDKKTLKKLTASDFRLVFGSKPGVLLDARSFLSAADERLSCSSYRFGDIYERRHGKVAIFATQLEGHGMINGVEWSGPRWITDLWRKGAVRRDWRLVERHVSRLEDNADIPRSVRALQLWR